MEARHAQSIRYKIVGTLVRRARSRVGMTQAQCADALGCSASAYGRCERGEEGLALPELEILAYLFQVPPSALWSEDSELPGTHPDAGRPPLDQILQLRRKILAVQVRRARESVGLSVAEMARSLDCSEQCLAEAELGERDLSLPQLEVIARECGLSIADFVDDDARPISNAERERQVLARVAGLSPDVAEFVLNPTNELYVRIGMQLTSLDAPTLRRIAEAILDITY